MNYFNNKRPRTEARASQPSKQPTANPTSSPPVKKQTNNNVWQTNPPATNKLNEETIEEIKAHVQEQLDKNNKAIRDEINDSNQTMNKRIGTLDKKIDNHTISVQNELQTIKEQSQNTQQSVQSSVDWLESIFWKMWSKFKDPPEEIEGMDYEKHRVETELKRGIEEPNESSIDLLISHDDIPPQKLAEPLQTQSPDTYHGTGNVNNNNIKK
jgi:hypothetical protein